MAFSPNLCHRCLHNVCCECSGICDIHAVSSVLFASYAAHAESLPHRSIAGFAFPLFAPQLYDTLGYGWGNSLLGFIGIAIGVPAPWIFWRYGAKMRARSQFAAGGS